MFMFRYAVFATLIAFAAVLRFRNTAQPWSTKQQRRLTGWLDPKTVVSKDTFHEGDINLKSLRYVAFGTSKTWGADLQDREHEAYIKVLSPNGVNLGLRATPADYPSLCLHSMIGDSVFDVIILEFSPYSGPHFEDFTRLIKRLRERFPDAVIVFVPMFMLFHDVMYKKRDIFDFILTQHIKSPHDPDFKPLIESLDDADLEYPSSSYAINDYKDAMENIQGYVVEFPIYQGGDIKQFIFDNLPYFGSEKKPWDYIHPNALGHMLIAANIRDKLTDIYSRPRPVKKGLGKWLGGEDRCISWFPNGNITDEIRELRNMEVVNFMEKDGKWALEVGRHGGSFNLLCPFSHCNIYFSYMAKGPERDYPRVMVSINERDPVMLDPLIGMFHLRQIAYVGTADHRGVASVTVKPVPEDVDVPHGFRLTGVIRTPTVH